MATQETIKQITQGGVTRDVEDSTARQAIALINAAIDALTGTNDTTAAINTMNEVVAFLNGVTNNETLTSKLTELRTLITEKYTKPSSGIPASDIASGVIPDVSGKANKSEMSVTQGTGANADKTTIQLKSGTSATVLTQHQDISGKVDKVNGKGLSTNDYDNTEMAKVASAVQNISVNGTQQQKSGNNVNINIPAGAQGKSAYEIAVQQGFEGDEDEWLESLKGAKGDTGNFVLTDGDLNNLTIVNDLEGGNGVLDARQGKVIGDLLDDLDERLDAMEGAMTAYVTGERLVLTPLAGTEPLVIATAPDRTTLHCKAGGNTIAKFSVLGRRLTDNIAIALSDTTNYSLSVNSLAQVGGRVNATEITVTYHPASGTANNTQHPCTITVSSGSVTYAQLQVTGQVVELSVLTVTPSELSIIAAASNEQGSGIIHIAGSALDADVVLTLSDATHFSFSSSSAVNSLTVPKASAEASGGVDVTVYYDGSGTQTASVTVATTGVTPQTVALTGKVPAAQAEGTTFVDDNLHLLFTVLADTSKVSVKGYNIPEGDNEEGTDIIIPATISDAGKTCSLNGTDVTGDGYVYDVVEIPSPGSTSTASTTFFNAKSVVMPNSITAIGERAFAKSSTGGTPKIKSIVVSTGVTSIPSACFYGLMNLETITGLDNVTSISGSAFQACSALQSLYLPSLTSISTYVFNGLSGAQKILIKSARVTNKSYSAFRGHLFITNSAVVGMDGSTSQWWKNAFSSVTIDGVDKIDITLHVPNNLLSNYQAQSQWQDAKEIIGESDVVGAFNNLVVS